MLNKMMLIFGVAILFIIFYIVISWWVFGKKKEDPEEDLLEFIGYPLYIFLFVYIISANIIIALLGMFPFVLARIFSVHRFLVSKEPLDKCGVADNMITGFISVSIFTFIFDYIVSSNIVMSLLGVVPYILVRIFLVLQRNYKRRKMKNIKKELNGRISIDIHVK